MTLAEATNAVIEMGPEACDEHIAVAAHFRALHIARAVDNSSMTRARNLREVPDQVWLNMVRDWKPKTAPKPKDSIIMEGT